MARTVTINNLTLLEDGQALPGGAVSMRGERFLWAGVGPPPAAEGQGEEVRVNGEGWMAAPGYVDLQLNGAYGHDFTRDPARIPDVAARLPESGVTAFLPTFISSPLASYGALLRAVQVLHEAPPNGARVLGAHVEGPFLSPQRPGAHDPAVLVPPSPAALAQLQPLEAVRLLTLAPEVAGGLEVARWLRERGVTVSMGHSMATVNQAEDAVTAGVTCATHLFNAMAPLHHRQPGLAGFVLSDDRVRFGLIADGVHVHARLVSVAYRARGPGALALVTDAMAGMGMPPGEYEIGGQRVIVDETSARLENGVLAGSILRLDQAVRNVAAFTGCSAAQAVQMASATPAAIIGAADHLGHLRPGYAADLVLLDAQLLVQATFVGGRLVYAGDGARGRFTKLSAQV